ncbi:hypothetical protein D9M68_662860 [compost metagenome]
MAIFKGKNLKGSFGNITFSRQGDSHIIKSKITNIKQTAATKKTASVFGRYISPFAKLIRRSFDEVVNGYADGSMVNRMNSAVSMLIYQYIDEDGNFHFQENSFNRLRDFNFNLSSPLDKTLLVKPLITFTTGMVEIKWPEFRLAKNLRFPPNATRCRIHFCCTRFCLAQAKWDVRDMEEIMIQKSQLTTVEQIFQYPMPEGCLFLLAMGISYSGANLKSTLNSKRFHPAGIVDVHYLPGTPQAAEIDKWMPLPFAMPMATPSSDNA